MTPSLVAGVLLAGAVGSVLRFAVSRALAGRLPWGVFVVNVAGSAVAGAVAASGGGDLRLIVVTGFCGGLTTFSAFAVETVELVLAGRARVAAASVIANLVLGVGAAALAYTLVS